MGFIIIVFCEREYGRFLSPKITSISNHFSTKEYYDELEVNKNEICNKTRET